MRFPIPRVPCVWMLLLFPAHPLSLWAEFVEVAPQVKIYYESSGQGNPLLFVPGWMMTAESRIGRPSWFSRQTATT